MADDIPCRHCGQSETSHIRPQDVDDPGVSLAGYQVSLTSCSGYKPENPELAEQLAQEAANIAYDEAMARCSYPPGD